MNAPDKTALAVRYADVADAAQRLAGHAHRTPVMTSRTVDERTGARVFFKCENFQRMGAFKFRGAFNAMSRLASDERERGVLAYSSGNHAQAVALAGKLLGVRVTIVMPADAPAVKLEATRGSGAEGVLYDKHKEVAEEVAALVAGARGARTHSLGRLTVPLMLRYVHDMITVSDAELVRAMFYLWERMKIVVEPTGALGAAGLFERGLPVAGKRVGVILSGGNVDLKLLTGFV